MSKPAWKNNIVEIDPRLSDKQLELLAISTYKTFISRGGTSKCLIVFTSKLLKLITDDLKKNG